MFLIKGLKPEIIVKSLICIITIGALIWWLVESDSPNMKEKLEEAKVEYNSLEIMPDSIQVYFDASNKASSVLVDGYYDIDAEYQQIKEYYIAELQNNGWKLDDEQVSNELGKGNYNELSFHKGEYNLYLDFYDRVSQGYTYDIAITWGR